MGTYTALTGLYLHKLFIMSIAVGLIIVVLLSTHYIMDYDYDKKAGKRTLSTLTGSKKGALILLAGEILIAYLIIISVSYTHMTLPTNLRMCSSRWWPYQ